MSKVSRNRKSVLLALISKTDPHAGEIEAGVAAITDLTKDPDKGRDPLGQGKLSKPACGSIR